MTSQTQFLPDIARQLAASYTAAGRSPKTVQSYTETICQFSEYALDRFATDDPDEITVEMIESYTGWVRQTRSPATSKIRFVTLRACWRWAMKRGFIERDLFVGIPSPTVDQKTLALLDDADVRAILDTCNGNTLLDRRDRAILLVLADSACRRQDIAQAKVADLDLATGRLLLRQTKANRDRQVALSPTTMMAVKRWLRERDRIVVNGTAELFLSRSGGPLTGDGLHHALHRRYRLAGVPVARAVHSFRSWSACRMLDNGAQESEVMALAGWRSQQMLLRYQRGRNADRALARHSTFSPVSGL